MNTLASDAEVAFSSIPHRKGKTPAISTMNSTAKSVNEYVSKLTKKESYLYYLNMMTSSIKVFQ